MAGSSMAACQRPLASLNPALEPTESARRPSFKSSCCICPSARRATFPWPYRLEQSSSVGSGWDLAPAAWGKECQRGVAVCCAGSIAEPKAVGTKATSSAADQFLFHVVAEEYGDGVRYRHVIRSKNHLIHGDLGLEYGGSDFGPSPKELVLSGLAMDASLTVRMFADRKGWPLRAVRVDVKEHGRGRGQIPEGIEVAIFLEGDLTREQKSALLTAAGKCPMKNLLLGKMTKGISTRLALKSERKKGPVADPGT